MYIYILYMQVLNGCLAETEFLSCRLTYVYMYLHACTVQFVCTHYMDVCMYTVYMQVVNGCLATSDRQTWCPAASAYIYMYLQVCIVQLYAHTWTEACTMYMYIVYLQVLNGCLAA